MAPFESTPLLWAIGGGVPTSATSPFGDKTNPAAVVSDHKLHNPVGKARLASKERESWPGIASAQHLPGQVGYLRYHWVQHLWLPYPPLYYPTRQGRAGATSWLSQSTRAEETPQIASLKSKTGPFSPCSLSTVAICAGVGVLDDTSNLKHQNEPLTLCRPRRSRATRPLSSRARSLLRPAATVHRFPFPSGWCTFRVERQK